MSRSFKQPYIGWTKAESEKEDKKRWHRAARRGEKVSLTVELNSYIPKEENYYSTPWDMAKDGRQYWDTPEGRRK